MLAKSGELVSGLKDKPWCELRLSGVCYHGNVVLGGGGKRTPSFHGHSGPLRVHLTLGSIDLLIFMSVHGAGAWVVLPQRCMNMYVYMYACTYDADAAV